MEPNGILNITCATVCSPSGISSVLNATLCTTLVASASRIILKRCFIRSQTNY